MLRIQLKSNILYEMFLDFTSGVGVPIDEGFDGLAIHPCHDR